MDAGAGLHVYDVVVKTFTFAISSPDEFLFTTRRFHVNKNIKQTYKGGLHFTVICCTNECIINERFIPEHQNKLNIYDLQNYDFFVNFFQPKKIRKIR